MNLRRNVNISEMHLMIRVNLVEILDTTDEEIDDQ
jgi:hypothetical protein